MSTSVVLWALAPIVLGIASRLMYKIPTKSNPINSAIQYTAKVLAIAAEVSDRANVTKSVTNVALEVGKELISETDNK